MTKPVSSFSGFRRNALATVIATLALTASDRSALSAAINYGSYGPVNGVQFINVTEDSATDPVPMYGTPSLFSVGLDFDPTSFVATAGNGGSDTTSGQLTFTIQTAPNIGVAQLTALEGGDYSVVGAGGGAATSISFELTLNITVTELNGVAVAPFDLAPVNGSVSHSLPGNVALGTWSLGLLSDIAAQLSAGQLATRIEVTLDNEIIANSEQQTISFGAKKDFQVSVVTEEATEVPDSGATGWLLLSAAFLMALPRGLARRVA